jgi:SAM-dependent methyltransferase
MSAPSASTFAKADERGVPSLVWRAGQNRRLEMIVTAAGAERLSPQSRVLVDGCGVGLYVKALRQFTPHVAGLDIEPERARDSLAHSPLVKVAAGEYLPYPVHTFDLVLSHEVIEHVQDDALTVAEMVRVLKPGGRAIIFCPNRLYPFETHGHYWRDITILATPPSSIICLLPSATGWPPTCEPTLPPGCANLRATFR